MRASLKLGRIAGIPIGLHYSWLIIATLITLSLAAHFQSTDPGWPRPLVWASALVTSALFFVSLVAHELSHAVVARRRGIPVRSITLFALGGVAQIDQDPASAKAEFSMAIAGPIMSLAIGIGCLAAARAAGWNVDGGPSSAPAAILGWLGSINVVLAVFNLIPGYPLDGGRVLRAILWGAQGDADRATRQAARVGQAVAALFMFYGLLRFFGGAGIGGLWFVFIGWFLLDAARASSVEVAISSSLRGIRAGDVMTGDCASVAGGTALEAFAALLLRSGQRCFMVENEAGRPVGLITPQEVRRVDRSQWGEVRVADVMRPLDRIRTVTPSTPVIEALRVMSREDLNQLPVMDDGHLAGIVTRGHLIRLIQTRAELNG